MLLKHVVVGIGTHIAAGSGSVRSRFNSLIRRPGLNWDIELSPVAMKHKCSAFLRSYDIESYAINPDVTEGHQQRDGVFDVRIPNEQFAGEIRLLKIVCRPVSFVTGQQYMNDLKRAVLGSPDRSMVAILLTTRPLDPALKHEAAVHDIATLSVDELPIFASALKEIKAGRRVSNYDSCPVLSNAFRFKSDVDAENKALEEQARAAEKEGDWPLAEQHLRGIIKTGGGTAFIHVALAEALSSQGMFDEASRVLENAAGLFRGRFHIVAASARLPELQDDWQEANLRWTEVIRRHPTNWMAYRGKAGAIARLSSQREADEFLLLHAKQFPRDLHALFDIVVITEKRRDWPGVESLCLSCLAINKNVRWAYLRLARAQKEQGRLVEAQQTLKQMGDVEVFSPNGSIASVS